MDRNDWTRTGNRTVRSGVSSDDFPLKRKHSGIGPGVCQGLARSGFPQGFASSGASHFVIPAQAGIQ